MSPRRRVLRAWAIGLIPVLVLAAVLAVALVRHRREASGAAASQAAAGPVLLVSGYGGGTGSLQVLAARLEAGGRQVQIVPPVGDNTGDLRVQAEALGRLARQEVSAGAPSVDVVGYSAGGVVVRIWAAELGGAKLARRIVTLGSPHHGTDVAALAAALLAGDCPTACRQLVPDSDVLRRLPETPSGPRWVSLYTADDQTVTPPESARLSGALDIELQQICSGARVSHSELPAEPLTGALVALALNGAGLRAAPPPSQCASLSTP